MADLHIVNGDAAAADLAALGEPLLVWADVLHEGPLAPIPPAQLRARRVRFLAAAGFGSRAELAPAMAARDAALESIAPDADLVLWFADDLDDQLLLVQLLHRLAARHPAGITKWEGRLRLAHLPRGPRTHLRERLAAARVLGAPALGLARAAWAALCAPEPIQVQELWLAGTPELPDLAPALERLLEELPATTDGLARSERQILRALRAGPLSPVELFAPATAGEERPYLGDTTLWWRASGLMPALVRRDDRGALALTVTGARVLAGEEDAVRALGGLDRWVAGTRVHGLDPWRWDPVARRSHHPVQ